MRYCLVAIGGNVGNVGETIAGAVEALRDTPGIDVETVSSTYGTRAVGADAGDAFVNAAVSLRTDLSALRLLDVLQHIEDTFGRVRTIRWGPRTLDLDLITCGDEVIESNRLTVPHPACWYRRFVLDPIAEIAPDVVHPVFHQTFGELRGRLLPRPLPIGLSGAPAAVRDELKTRLRDRFSDGSISLAESPALRAAITFDIAEPRADAHAEAEDVHRIAVPSGDVGQQFQFVCDVLTAALG